MRHFAGDFLTVGEAAQQLSIPRKTIHRWCESGKLQALPKPYGESVTYLISPQAVELLKISLETKDKLRHSKTKKQKLPQEHRQYRKSWKRAMQKGLLNGRVFSPRTIETYDFYAEKFFEEYETLSLESLKAQLMQVPAHQFGKREKIYKTLVCLGKFLIQEGALKPEFLEDAKPLVPKRHLPAKRVSVDDTGLQKLLQACESLIITLLSQTGLRASEACQLRLSDIDLENAVLTVRCGKGGKARKVGLSPSVIAILGKYLKEYPQSGSEAPLLLNKSKKAMDRHGLFQRIQRLADDAGINASPHALRRSFVTLNANKGRPLQMLQMACGHSDVKTTMSYCLTAQADLISEMRQWE